MKKNRRKVFMAAGYQTVSLGTGRKEFHPKKPRPGLEEYIQEAGRGVLGRIGGGKNVDESVIGNFMAARFNKQGHLAALIPSIDADLRWKPATRVECACASGGVALTAAIRSVLAGTADVVLTVGVEVQNTVKAVYGADILAGAGWYRGERKKGHAYFFPSLFSDRAGAYFEKFGRDKTRKAFARWYRNAVENARLCETAQECHSGCDDLEAQALAEPHPRSFVDHLNVFDCSKVSDGAAAIAVMSEEGLERCGVSKDEAVEVVGWGQVEADLTVPPSDLAELETTRRAVEKALTAAGVRLDEIGTVECHDCFTISGILSVEAIGLAAKGEGAEYVLAGRTSRKGEVPFNTSGGLIGWGHPTGCTGVRQAVTIWQQLTGKAGASQIKMSRKRPYALSVNMGGNDKTVVAIVYKKAGRKTKVKP
ncbi:MAG TPA: beta-ketoacyl synthase N-terminal-like domain-containing protein [Acidobacteriota bacterium]|nr:beta-ketoacyl synthase N-terminal-like domain-containing protein [Acidobacteriota bacterium]